MDKIQSLLDAEFTEQLGKLKLFTQHGPSIGRHVELLFLEIFKKYMPRKYRFTSGFVVGNDTEDTSPQIDIICHDHLNFPIIYESGELTVVPAHSVKALIEIKSTFKKSDFDQVIKVCESESLTQVPEDQFGVYIVGVNSNTPPEKVFEQLVAYYSGSPESMALIYLVYCLDWEKAVVTQIAHQGEEIVSGVEMERHELSINLVKFDMSRKISFIFAQLLKNIYGKESVESIRSLLGRTLYRVEDSYSQTFFLNKNAT